MFEKFGYPEFSSTGEQIVTTREGNYKNMMMDIRVFRIKAGEERTYQYAEDEMCILLMSGKMEFAWEGETTTVSRSGVFTEKLYCLHVCKNIEVKIKVLEDVEILIQRTENDRTFASKFYYPDDVMDNLSGVGLCNDTAVRYVQTAFDYNTAPYSNMVIGEVINNQGSWSGYQPHDHPQPEVYYFKFDKPQGFGGSFMGDEAFVIKEGSFAAIQGGLTHPQVTAPGYRMYTCWMIRHFDGDPWTDRIDDPQHLWMLDQDFSEQNLLKNNMMKK